MESQCLIVDSVVKYIRSKNSELEVAYINDSIDLFIQIRSTTENVRYRYILFETPKIPNKRDVIISLSDPDFFLKLDNVLNDFR